MILSYSYIVQFLIQFPYNSDTITVKILHIEVFSYDSVNSSSTVWLQFSSTVLMIKYLPFYLWFYLWFQYYSRPSQQLNYSYTVMKWSRSWLMDWGGMRRCYQWKKLSLLGNQKKNQLGNLQNPKKKDDKEKQQESKN